MLFNLDTQIDRERATRRFTDLMEQRTVMELKKKVRRSTSQNSYIHLLIGYFSMETGYTLVEAKKIYKDCSPQIYVYEKKGKEFIRSSASLTSTEMATSTDRFMDYSSREAGITLPTPSDLAFLSEIEIELSRNKPEWEAIGNYGRT